MADKPRSRISYFMLQSFWRMWTTQLTPNLKTVGLLTSNMDCILPLSLGQICPILSCVIRHVNEQRKVPKRKVHLLTPKLPLFSEIERVLTLSLRQTCCILIRMLRVISTFLLHGIELTLGEKCALLPFARLFYLLAQLPRLGLKTDQLRLALTSHSVLWLESGNLLLQTRCLEEWRGLNEARTIRAGN